MGDGRPFRDPSSSQFGHSDAKGTVSRKANNRQVRAADLGTQNDRRQAVAAGAKQTWRKVFAPGFETRIGVADGAVVADIGRDDGVFRQGLP